MKETKKSYNSYDEVPIYRQQWFFWIMYIIFSPVAIGILLFGDVYYPKDGEVKSFGIANRIVAGIIAVFIMINVFEGFVS